MNKNVIKAKLNDELNEIKQLEEIYRQAREDILEKIELQNGRIEVLLKDIDKLSDEERSVLQSAIYQKTYQKALLQQIETYTTKLQADAYKSIEEYIEKAYEVAYIGNMYDLHEQGIPLTIPIDPQKVKIAMNMDSKLSGGLLHRMGVDINKLKRKIANEIARGISAGQGYNEIARNIMNGTTESFNSAMRIARTEGGRVASISQMDAMMDAKEHGADVVKQWDSALDGRTREAHRRLDGQIRELDEAFEVYDDKLGTITADKPHGFGIASQDINCRCAMNQRARWMLDEDELTILEERANYFGLKKAKDFEDFKRKYLKNVTK